MRRSRVVVTILLVGAFATATPALRVIEEVEDSAELALRELTLPTAATGTLEFRSCATCHRTTHSVTEKTTYHLNGLELPLAEFLAGIAEIRRRPPMEARAVAFVYYDLATRDVNRVRVHVRAR